MIFQIADATTGALVTTVAADSEDIARRYLEPGQTLYVGGPMSLDRSRLMVTDGVVTQRPYVGPDPDGLLQGDGDALMEVTRG